MVHAMLSEFMFVRGTSDDKRYRTGYIGHFDIFVST